MKSTKNIKVPEKIVDQVIGQDEGVNIIKKAAQQRRHVLLIGEPGTGKSMLGMALAELLPKEKLVDVLALPNPNDENNPLIQEMNAGTGREEIKKYQLDGKQVLKNNNFLLFLVAILTLIAPWWVRHQYHSDLMFTAFFLGGMLFLAAFAIMMSMGPRVFATKQVIAPKLIVDNFGKKQAVFFDATGAHAGALLGDVLHDPFQCFTYSKIYITEDIKRPYKVRSIAPTVNNLLKKHKVNIIRNKEYEAVFLDKNELFILGETNGSVAPVEVLSCNRQSYNGKMIKLTTSANKELIVTPEHKIAVDQNSRIAYVEAKDIQVGDNVFSKAEDVILDEQDIINTYDKHQQEQGRLYHQYLDLKAQSPAWGYKRLAKNMGQPYGKTRWWHAGKHIPVPIQTAHWLKERGLLPLKADNPQLPLIAKVLGATFGDGGIFENLNGIFLSSAEKKATEEFGNDLVHIFGNEVNQNQRTIEGGVKGHSWCYQNTNRNVIRFFVALGAPRGNKTTLELKIPNWLYLSETFADEFFGSFLGGEMGAPKVHKQKNRLQTLDVAITGPKEMEQNRIDFMNKIKIYIESKDVQSTSIVKQTTYNKDLFLYRLLLSTKFDNVMNFIKNIKINYCYHKKQKIITPINEFSTLKKAKYQELITRGYGAEQTMKLLNLTPRSLYVVLNGERIEP